MDLTQWLACAPFLSNTYVHFMSPCDSKAKIIYFVIQKFIASIR